MCLRKSLRFRGSLFVYYGQPLMLAEAWQSNNGPARRVVIHFDFTTTARRGCPARSGSTALRFGQDLPGFLHIFAHLIYQGPFRIEGTDLAEIAHEIDADLLAVDVLIEVKQVYLDGGW